MFNKKIKITLKKSIAVLMTVTMISIGMIPINSVYANMSVTISGNNSTSESGSNRPYDTSKNIGDMWAEGVRCYIYNRAGNESTGDKFIKTEDGYEAIDFLGENGGMEMASLVSESDRSHETAFGEVDTVDSLNDYPFEINGNTKYWVSIKGFGTQSDLEELDEWLNADHGVNIAGIIEKYWGTEQLQRVRHDANLLFCVEPIQIVPSVCDDGDMETDFSVWQETYDVDCYTYKYGSVFESDTEIKDNCKNGYEYDKLDMVDNIEKHHYFE